MWFAGLFKLQMVLYERLPKSYSFFKTEIYKNPTFSWAIWQTIRQFQLLAQWKIYENKIYDKLYQQIIQEMHSHTTAVTDGNKQKKSIFQTTTLRGYKRVGAKTLAAVILSTQVEF